MVEAFEGNRHLTVYEFLYCYKPAEIHKSLGFYQFLARDSGCRMIESLPTFNRLWKIEFFFISRFWASDPIEVGRDAFPLYTGAMGHLHSKSMLFLI